ncbi:MAG TPA: extracellular solute-binding protein, partial [Candidatus Paceibacterota bacterium]
HENVLINRLAEGSGPDVFFLKNSWVAKHKDKIFPLSEKGLKYGARDFRHEFVDIAAGDMLTAQGEILGLPLYVDTLALFYNKDIFNSSGVAAPPLTWEELLVVSAKVTRRDAQGKVTRGGLALGTTRNTENFFEILSALILQNGDPIIRKDAGRQISLEERAEEALKFYVSFANVSAPNYSGGLVAKSSLDALADGSVAMTIGFARDVKRVLARNPHLDLGIAPLPQVKDAPVMSYGSYYFPVVSRLSHDPASAWQLLFYVTSRDSVKKYLEATEKPAARRDLISLGAPTDELDVFYRQALVAKNWPVPEEASALRIFRDMIDAASSFTESSANQAVNRAKEQLRLLLP